MDRLTWNTPAGTANFDISPDIRHDAIARSAFYQSVAIRLAEIEKMLFEEDETGRWKERISLDRLSEICSAERDRRCVVLPCKVGQIVKVRADTWGNVWNYKTIEYGKFLKGEIIAIIKTKKQTLMKIQVEHNVSWKRERKRYPISAMGITVFPIYEATLKALTDQSHT